MECPRCQLRAKVVKTIPISIDGRSIVKRYRKCPSCGFIFHTLEEQVEKTKPK
jgi:transcriptional regulator NrdR family protein